MNTVILLLTLHGALGASDNLWHHEIKVRLPRQIGARHELALHAVRAALYVPVFLAFAWCALLGWTAWLLAALLMLELAITLADFVEEDRTRVLPASERILHTVLAVNYGAFLAVSGPVLLQWGAQPTAVVIAQHGATSWLLTFFAAGALCWSARDLAAAWRLARPRLATWQRQRFQIVRGPDVKRILITGATGFIGRLVARRLIESGHGVVVLCRDRAKALDLFGPHAQIVTSLESLRAHERIDAVINLAGEPIAAMRWTAQRKAVLVESRIGTTRMLVEWAHRLHRPPAVFVSASAIGRYGVHSAACFTEEAAGGADFPAALCSAWEREANNAHRAATRVVVLRLGLVLGRGGLLQRLLPIFRLGLGAPLGSGAQWMSWIHIDDVVAVVERALVDPRCTGVINVVAPHAVNNREFSTALSRACARPLWPAIPAALLRWTLGEMSTVVLDGQRVLPMRLQALGFRFKFATLSAALHDLLCSPRENSPRARGAQRA